MESAWLCRRCLVVVVNVLVFLCVSITNSQQIPFDEHYYGTRTNQPNFTQNYPNQKTPAAGDSYVPGNSRHFSNRTFMTDGNITEFYSPDVYGRGVPRRGSGNTLTNTHDPLLGPIQGEIGREHGGDRRDTLERGFESTPRNVIAPNEVTRRNPYDRVNSYPNDNNAQPPRNDYRGPQNSFPKDVGVRREESGSYQSAVQPPLPTVPYNNYNYPTDNYPKTIPNYTEYTGSRRNSDEGRGRQRLSSYQDGRSSYGQQGLNQSPGSSYRGYPGNQEQRRNYSQQSQRPYYPGSTGNQNYPGQAGVRNRNYQQGRGSFDPGDPHRNIWNEPWSTTTIRPVAPGVLGGWRPDLQGKQRQDDLHRLPETVFVQTSYGRVQVSLKLDQFVV